MGQFFIDLINSIIAGIGNILTWLISLFPDSPFQDPSSPPTSVNLGWITWIFDFPTWIVHLAAITSAILIYYAIRVIARWVKVARG